MFDDSALSRRTLLLAVGGLTIVSACGRMTDGRPTASTSPGPHTSGGPATTAEPPTPPAAPAHRAARPGSTPAQGHASHPTSVKRWVPGTDKHIALTIDDGPALPWTSDILALLTQHNVTATFCMIGASVARYPTIARLVIDGTHANAEETFHHNLTTILDGITSRPHT